MKRNSALLAIGIGALGLALAARLFLGAPSSLEIELVAEAAETTLAADEHLALAPVDGERALGRAAAPVSLETDVADAKRAAWPSESGHPSGQPRAIEGVVLDSEDQPVSMAKVILWPTEILTDGDGRFRLQLPTWLPSDARLFAVKAGLQPAMLPLDAKLTAPGATPLVLRLGPPTLEISGVVLRSDGAPAQNWHVDLTDGTPVSQGKFPAILLEDFAAGRADQEAEPTTSEWRGSRRTATPILSKDLDDRRCRRLQTNERGEFKLTGLSQRLYDIRATWSLTSARADQVPAGTTGLVLRADSNFAELRGTVVDPRGDPVPAVTVTVEFCTYKLGNASTWSASSNADSDENGEIVLSNVPWRDARFRITGSPVAEKLVDVGELRLGNGFRLTVELMCEVRIPLDTGGTVDRVEFVDGRGFTLSQAALESDWSQVSEFKARLGEARKPILPRPVSRFESAKYASTEPSGQDPESKAHFDAGDPFAGEDISISPVPDAPNDVILRVSELARTVVFLHGQRELSRRPLRLTPREVTEVRY